MRIRNATAYGLILAGLLAAVSGKAAPLAVSFKPSTADPAVTQFDNVHYAVVDPAVTAQGRLVLMLPGTGANPFMYKLFPQNAASLGFHALALMYPNGDPINSLSAQYAPFDPDAAGNARLEVIDGTDRVSFLGVNRTNCIENRLLKALQYLQAQNPTRGWGQYYSGDTLLWDKIIVCGHSQGGGMAGMLAKMRRTNRCMMFTDMDFWVAGNRPYNWMFASPQTPVHQWFFLAHERDQFLDFTEMQSSAAALGVDRYGAYVRIETATSPTFSGTHFLSTNLEPAPAAADSYHGCPVVDKAIPMLADGVTPVFKPAWDYMLLSPTPPDITWANPADINYGTALSATQLNATADVPGTFVYTPAAGTVLAAGAGQTLSVTFTPSDAVNYTSVTRTVSLTVAKADQAINFTAIADRVFSVVPMTLTATATSSLPVSFTVQSGPAQLDGNQLTLTGIGTVTVRAAQGGSANWNAAAPVDRSFTVSPAAPLITWKTPDDIYFGTPLSATQLNATADVAGTFAYTPAAGTVLLPGNYQSLHVYFTPDDRVNYLSSDGIVTINCLSNSSNPLVLTSEWPVLDNGGESGVAELMVDLSPEDKSGLTGSGEISVHVTPYLSTTQVVGNTASTITYVSQTTTPATVRFRKAPWMPNPANEFCNDLYWCTVATDSWSDSGVGKAAVVSGVSRGSYYATVKSYMEKNRDINFWVGLYLNDGGIHLDDLVRYQVPEEAFMAWAPIAIGPEGIAAGYKLGYQPEEYVAFGADSISWANGLYTGQAFGWGSAAEINALTNDYVTNVMPVNGSVSFSIRNRVPVSFFLSTYTEIPGGVDEKDYYVAAAWHREQGIQRLNDLGLPADELLASFSADYNLGDLNPVAPHALEAMARTYLDPSWRQSAPLALVIIDRAVLSDGSFSEADIIGTLARTHRLVVCDSNNTSSFLIAAGKAYQRNGPFDVVVFCGHGSENQSSVFVIDDADTGGLSGFGDMLSPGATVLLASCRGAYFNPDYIQSRVNGGHSTIHVAAATQAALPNARIVAASNLTNKVMLRYDAAAMKPEERYRVFFAGAHVYGDIPGLAPHGTPRDWLRREFGPTEDWAALESADYDGDCQANWLEYLSGTNPRSALDFFKITADLNSEGCPVLQWTGTCRNEHAVPFKVFRKYAQGEWTEVAQMVGRSVSGMNTWADTAVAVGPMSYRIALLSGGARVDLGTVVINGYTLTVSGGSGSGDYDAGTVVDICASAPVANKVFDKWTGDTSHAANVGASSTTITMPAANVAVTATYKDVQVVTHTITASAGANGSITPSDTVTVADRATQSFVIAADPGFQIVGVQVDGASVGIAASYTFTNVTADHTISASFAMTPPPLDFDFALSDHGFTAGFADLPADAGPPDFYALASGWQPRPENLGGAQALFITGNNHSDDLWMYWKKRLTGLEAAATYNLVVEVEFASRYPTGSVGVGGSPGDSVVLKAGAVAWEPLARVEADGWWRMNLDKDSGGNAAGGSDLFTLGTIAKPADGLDSYVPVTRTNQGQPRTVTTAADGSLWLAFGTDSGFEATTALYYTRLTVQLSRDTRQLPALAWAPPADIQYGTALSATQLNATANVPGTFVYTPAAGTVLLAGDTQPLSVTFHPDDTVNYTDATTSVTINCLFNLHLTRGWNLISLPLEPRNPQVASIFSATPGMIWANSIYAWHVDHYEMASELHVQRGYWLYAFEDVNVTLAGAPASGRVTLNAGWNLLGPNGGVSASALAAPLGQAPAWSWDGCYRTATELQPGAGYWLYAPVPASDYRLGP